MNNAENFINAQGKEEVFEAADNCMADIGIKTENLVSVTGNGEQVVVRAVVEIERTFNLDTLKKNVADVRAANETE